MPLSEDQIAQVRERAERAGISPEAAIKAAEKLSAQRGGSGGEEPDDSEGTATLAAERFLIGYLPYVTVRELRETVLGMSGDVADSDMFTGEWLMLHGGEQKPSSGGDE